MTNVRALLGAALVLGAFTLASAKLPAPPPMTDAQKAAAEEKKGKDATAHDYLYFQELTLRGFSFDRLGSRELPAARLRSEPDQDGG